MTAYWCELAWLGGARAEPGVLVEVEEGRIIGGHQRHPRTALGRLAP